MKASTEIPDLVGQTEIAQRLEVKLTTVWTWRHRAAKARQDARPEAVDMLPPEDLTLSGSPIWLWATVAAWAARTGRMPGGPPAARGMRPRAGS